MSQPEKACGCSGVRWCADCLDPGLRAAHKMQDPLPLPAAFAAGGEAACFDVKLQGVPGVPAFQGLLLIEDFLSEVEEAALLSTLEATPFRPAQSGKQKQHYGPRINFNKQRMNVRGFRGLPAYAHEVLARIPERLPQPTPSELARALAEFRCTDVFVLRYQESRRSNLDFHRDDVFGYGELIADLSLESDGALSFLDREPEAVEPGEGSATAVRVGLPRRSLALLYGPARTTWFHAILPQDIAGQRTSITFRSLSEPLRRTEDGGRVLEAARQTLPAPAPQASSAPRPGS